MATVTESPELTSEAQRVRLLGRYIGRPVEMLAGPDELCADRGRFLFIRAGDGIHEPGAVVEFERNGRWAIPISMLHVAGVDHVVEETSAFVIAGRHAPERRHMVVSFELVCAEHQRENGEQRNECG